MIDRAWFHKIGISSTEYNPPYLAVHIHAKNQTCKLFKVHEKQFETPDIWQYLRDLSNELGIPADPLFGVCPECQMPRKAWERRYQERKFCGWCGSKL